MADQGPASPSARGARGPRGGAGGERRRGAGDRQWRWLESTAALQREAFGHDWEAIGRTDTHVAASLKDNIFAALVELGEAAREFSWKSWAQDLPFVNRRRLIEELVDVAHFVANCLLALGVTDDEWENLYRAKQQVNRERQQRGYSARKD